MGGLGAGADAAHLSELSAAKFFKDQVVVCWVARRLKRAAFWGFKKIYLFKCPRATLIRM